MTTVGFVGSGQIGSTVARLAVEAGHHVVLSNSRGPETLAATIVELGPRASAASTGEAAAAGDIVVVTVPVKAFADLPAAPLAGKTVIDTCNYGPERDGQIPELVDKSLTSSELLLRYIPDAMLVKAFNNIYYKHLLSLARPEVCAPRRRAGVARGDDSRLAGRVQRRTRQRGCPGPVYTPTPLGRRVHRCAGGRRRRCAAHRIPRRSPRSSRSSRPPARATSPA
jgi:predicted dinucleotide-binding enzyme